MNGMDAMVKDLAECRQAEAQAKERIAEIEREQAKTPLGLQLAEFQRGMRAIKDQLAVAKANVRQATLTAYQQTGEKQPHPSVKVVMSTVLSYNEKEALDYCRTYIPNALKLDRRTFEKAAKVLELEFVTIGQEPTTRIDSDLSVYLIIG